ncbi:hypothetical protein [Pedobacter sp. Leaf250]|uniref:hypothetical protein n=1 Tax=Pedobacter sp. Leaf250 TaxID=2876559 RepID=UPI001E3783EC|nr:hypothetical protein [Pedobacter sp. Leaf250]
MKTISGSYPKNFKEVDFSVKVPEDWTELEKYQFARIIEVLHFTKADKYTISVSLLALLFGPENYPLLRNLSEVKAMEPDDPSGDELLHMLTPLTNFIFETKPPVKNFFPYIQLKKKKHIAPADDLSNLSFGEWCFAHQYYIYYSITKDKEWLIKLIATIYRPVNPLQNPESANYNGDQREAFNENLIEKRALSVADLENHIQLGIMAWFSVALAEVSLARPHVFPPAPDVDPENPQPVEEMEPDTSRTWLTIFRELLGPKWGTEQQLKFTNAMFVLDELEDKHIAFEEAKKQN